MSDRKKNGRPQTENPTNIMLAVRVDTQTKARLIELSDKLNISRSAVVRRGIDGLYEKADADNVEQTEGE